MPASPTDSNATSSTSSAARERAATEAAATEAAATAPEATSPPADGARDVTQSVSPPSGTGSGTRSKASDPACPTCRGPLERYLGSAAHKLGSYWCHACGVRQRLPASPPADEATASASTSGTKAAGAG